ncbi:Alpha-1,3-mannosyltransferase-like protein [Balamuthia mandrillaris]
MWWLSFSVSAAVTALLGWSLWGLVSLYGFKSRLPRGSSTNKQGDKKASRLKIAFIHPDLGIGGAERLVVDAALGLQSAGHSVVIFTAHHDPSHCFVETINGTLEVRVYGDWLPRSFLGRFHTLFALLRNFWVAHQLVKQHHKDASSSQGGYDIIFSDSISASIPLFKRATNAKVVFYCHFPDQLLTQRKSFLKKLYRWPIDWVEEITTGMADIVLVNSIFTQQTFLNTFQRLAQRDDPPTVVYPSINFQQYDMQEEGSDDENKNKANEEEAEELMFLSVNRYERKKNIGLAIEAFAKLKELRPKLYPRLRLVIAGGYDPRNNENKEHFEELVATAKQLNVPSDQISFLRSISAKERNRLLHKCLAVIYTPENEHFGIVPVEAMYAKRPVIACNSGGPTESIKDGETGFLCSPNAASFAEKMALLVDSGITHARETFGEAARAHVLRKFSLARFTEQLEDCMGTTTAKKKRED